MLEQSNNVENGKELLVPQNSFIYAMTPEFKSRVKEFKKDWYKKYTNIAKEKTPDVDGTGKKIIKPKGNTGFNYIEETYMRDRLDKHFPGWSWEMAAPLHFLGAEWVVAQGHLIIVDESLCVFGVEPIRKFYGVDSVRIQYGRGTTHLPENIVDVGDNCKQANTAAMKYAINRMCRIGDDVYGKRLEMEGAGTIEDIISGNVEGASAELVADAKYKAFGEWLIKYKIRWSEVYKINGGETISDYSALKEKIKKEKGIA